MAQPPHLQKTRQIWVSTIHFTFEPVIIHRREGKEEGVWWISLGLSDILMTPIISSKFYIVPLCALLSMTDPPPQPLPSVPPENNVISQKSLTPPSPSPPHTKDWSLTFHTTSDRKPIAIKEFAELQILMMTTIIWNLRHALSTVFGINREAHQRKQCHVVAKLSSIQYQKLPLLLNISYWNRW